MEAAKYVSEYTSPDDCFKTEYQKLLCKNWAPCFCDIVNTCFEEGIFPSVFKISVIFPLLKKVKLDPNKLDSYRPVSNITFLAKVIERIKVVQLIEHFEKYQLIDPFQSAYRKHHSTETALIATLNDIVLHFDNGQQVLVLSLDLSAAFDTLSHFLILEILTTYAKLSPSAVQLMKSYLTERKQCVL